MSDLPGARDGHLQHTWEIKSRLLSMSPRGMVVVHRGSEAKLSRSVLCSLTKCPVYSRYDSQERAWRCVETNHSLDPSNLRPVTWSSPAVEGVHLASWFVMSTDQLCGSTNTDLYTNLTLTLISMGMSWHSDDTAPPASLCDIRVRYVLIPSSARVLDNTWYSSKLSVSVKSYSISRRARHASTASLRHTACRTPSARHH